MSHADHMQVDTRTGAYGCDTGLGGCGKPTRERCDLWGQPGIPCCSPECMDKMRVQALDPERATFDTEIVDRAAADEQEMLVRTGTVRRCASSMGGCGRPTPWLDLSWGTDVPCCSWQCKRAMNAAYAQALLKKAEAESGSPSSPEAVAPAPAAAPEAAAPVPEVVAVPPAAADDASGLPQ